MKELLIMALGGGSYVLVELLWRGRSHVSMFFLGGLCFWLIGQLDRRKPIPLVVQACLGAVVVTVLEFLTGLVVNRWLGLGVWDYSALPMNLLGQVCLYYFVLWIPLAAAAVVLEDAVRLLLFGTPMPKYRLCKTGVAIDISAVHTVNCKKTGEWWKIYDSAQRIYASVSAAGRQTGGRDPQRRLSARGQAALGEYPLQGLSGQPHHGPTGHESAERAEFDSFRPR